MTEKLTPKDLATKLANVFEEMDSNIYRVISKNLASHKDTESDLLYPPKFLEEIWEIYSKTAGTNYLREYLCEYKVKLTIPDANEVIEKIAFPYSDQLKSLMIDFKKSQYGIFEREYAQKFEVRHLATLPLILDIQFMNGSISGNEHQEKLLQKYSWVEEFESFYHKPYDSNDNLASIASSINVLTFYRVLNNRQY